MTCCAPSFPLTAIPGPEGLGFTASNGTSGVNAYAVVTVDFIVPPDLITPVTVLVSSTAWNVVGQVIVIEQSGNVALSHPGPATFVILSIPSAGALTLLFLHQTNDVPFGTPISAGTYAKPAAPMAGFSCDPEKLINTIATPQILAGSSCYDPVANLILFNDTTGTRSISDITVVGGPVAYSGGGDLGHHMDYASSTDRVYESVISGTTYIQVINPNTMTSVTTFNNALPYQFNYLKYSPEKDRLYCTQSDAANLNGRVINPHTNSIVGNFVFSIDPANEFQGGIDVNPNRDEIYVARQGSFATTQSMRIFNGTTLAFITAIDISPFTPNNMIYVDAFDRFVAVGVDFNSNLPEACIINPNTRTIEAIVPLPGPFGAGDVIYYPICQDVAIQCSAFMVFMNMTTHVLRSSVPITGGGLEMSYNSNNQKVYHPHSGVKQIDTFH